MPEMIYCGVDSSEVPVTLEARLSLFGFVPTPAVLLVTPRTRQERITRSLLSMTAATLIAPLVFFIPPHLEWVMLSIAMGVYWARRHWIAEYIVASFEGVCPRCHQPVKIRTGTTLRLPHSTICYGCHEHPSLEAGSAPPVDPSLRTEAGSQRESKVEARRPTKNWSPAGSDW